MVEVQNYIQVLCPSQVYHNSHTNANTITPLLRLRINNGYKGLVNNRPYSRVTREYNLQSYRMGGTSTCVHYYQGRVMEQWSNGAMEAALGAK
jgi:hypothetical protein